MNRVILLTIFFIVYHFGLFAQDNTIGKQITKQQVSNNPSSMDNKTNQFVEIVDGNNLHYKLHFHQNTTDSLSYYKAASLFDRYDNYRFLNQRRIIYFDNRQVSIELFSANELKEKYGKRISPYTIKEGSTYPEIEFHLEDGLIKEVLIHSK